MPPVITVSNATKPRRPRGETVALLDSVAMRVRLRPLRPDDVDEVLAARDSVVGEPGPDARARMLRRIEAGGKLVGGRLDLGIDMDGELVGHVDARCPEGAMPPGVFEIGIELHGTPRRGHGLGTEAVELLADHLFRTYDAGRVQASTALGNTAMRRVLEKTGFTFEGVLRGFMPGPGGRVDYTMYGLTRTDWESR